MQQSPHRWLIRRTMNSYVVNSCLSRTDRRSTESHIKLFNFCFSSLKFFLIKIILLLHAPWDNNKSFVTNTTSANTKVTHNATTKQQLKSLKKKKKRRNVWRSWVEKHKVHCTIRDWKFKFGQAMRHLRGKPFHVLLL